MLVHCDSLLYVCLGVSLQGVWPGVKRHTEAWPTLHTHLAQCLQNHHHLCQSGFKNAPPPYNWSKLSVAMASIAHLCLYYILWHTNTRILSLLAFCVMPAIRGMPSMSSTSLVGKQTAVICTSFPDYTWIFLLNFFAVLKISQPSRPFQDKKNNYLKTNWLCKKRVNFLLICLNPWELPADWS